MPTTEYAVDQFFQNGGTSPKMVYDAAGVLGWSPHNTCLQSQTFDNASWAKSAGTLSANAIAAPDGTTTADAWTPGSGVVDTHLSQTSIVTTSGVANTISVYMKNGTLGNNWIQVLWLGGTNNEAKWFNLATGAMGSAVQGTIVASSITDVGSGWYRCTLSVTATTTSASIYLAPRNADGSTASITGNGTSPCYYAWGAQLNLGTVPTVYLPTTTAARVGLALDYDPVTHAAKGLLCEPQATNLCTQSAGGRTGFAWSGNGSTFTPAQPDPSGGNEALLVVANANLGINAGQQVTAGITAGQVYTGSCWCKGTAGQQIYFNPSSEVTPSAQITVTFTGGWQRVSKSFTAVGTAAYLTFERYDRIGSAHLPNVTFTIWGGQCETGTVATSYIPTLAATVTRAGDMVRVTPASINYSATAGSWWVDVELLSNAVAIIIGYQSSYSPFYVQTTTQFALFDTSLLSKLVASTLGFHKITSAFQASDRALTADGLTVAADAGATANLLAPSTITIGTGNGLSINGHIRKLRYLPRRPPNTQLVTDTT